MRDCKIILILNYMKVGILKLLNDTLKNSRGCVELLLSHGADVNEEDDVSL